MQNDQMGETCEMLLGLIPNTPRGGEATPASSVCCMAPAAEQCQRCGKHFCQDHALPSDHGCEE